MDLPKDTGFYLWYILDLDYFDVGCVQILWENEKHIKRLKETPKEKRKGFYLYQVGFEDSITAVMYHQAHDHLPPCDEDGKPLVDGWIPFDFRLVGLIKEPPIKLEGKAIPTMSPEDQAKWLAKVKADQTPPEGAVPKFKVGDEVQLKTGLLPGRAKVDRVSYHKDRGFGYYVTAEDGHNRWENEEYLDHAAT